MTVYYHRTAKARAILARGFRDGTTYIGGLKLTGVFLSDQPVDSNEGAKGEQLLAVALPMDVDLGDFELIEEGKPYREWCVPAELLNQRAMVSAVR
jgi:hypothetical protein